MPDSMKKKILVNLKTILGELAFPNLIEYERIRVTESDFRPNEFPGIQIIDDGSLDLHQRSYVEVTWNVVIEYFQKANADRTHDAGLLYDRMFEIQRKIGDNVRLRIPSVSGDGSMYHVKRQGAITNLFLVDNISVGQLTYQIVFREPYTEVC